MLKKKESVKEGQKRDYEKAYTTFYNAYKNFANASMDVAKESTKISGDKTDQKIILKNFKKHVIPFIGLMSSWNKGHQKNPHLDESVNEGTKAFLAYREMKEALNVAIYGIKKMRKFIDDAPYNPKFNMITKELYKWEIDLEKKWRRVVPQISKISKDKMLESVNEKMSPAQYHSYMQYVFDKYHIRLTDTPGWYGVWDKNGKQKFEGDKKFVMKHLKKLKTRMGNYQLKSLIDVATKRKGKDISFDVVESVSEASLGDKFQKNIKKYQDRIEKEREAYKKAREAQKKRNNESVNEVSGVDVAKKVLKNKQMEKGIDLQTANLIVTIDKAYDKNPKLQKKFRKIQLSKMKQLIIKYYG
jgi:uncharacterized protein (DUF1778 family)